MSISTPPPPAPPKKRGMGCFGCGCLILVLILVLFAGLVVGGTYFGYTKAVSLTSPTPASIPSFNGPDDLYASARKKIDSFNHDVKNHQSAKLVLSADEINTLLARSPEVKAEKAQVFVSFTGDKARLQGSLPTENLPVTFVKDRFINIDTSFSLSFHPDTKTVDLHLTAAQIGEQVEPDNMLPAVEGIMNPVLNMQLQQNADFKTLVDQAKTVEIQDSQLVIETN